MMEENSRKLLALDSNSAAVTEEVDTLLPTETSLKYIYIF